LAIRKLRVKHLLENVTESLEIILPVNLFTLDLQLLFVLTFDLDYHVESWQQCNQFATYFILLILALEGLFIWGQTVLKVAKNLALVFQVISTNTDGFFVFYLSIKHFGVSKNDNTFAVNDSLLPLSQTEYVSIVYRNSYL
jgi:hypothetical protein